MSNLPKKWNLLALNQICDLQNGYAFKSSDYVNISSTLNCRMSNIRPNGVFDLEHNQKFLPDSYTEKYKQYLLKDGDVIIAMTDMATEAKILGVPTIVKTQGKNLLLNQRVGKLIIKKPELIYFPYLKYVLNREQVKKYFLKFAGGGLQINLCKDDILSVTIPLPPLEEQKKIAEILDQAEELRRKRKEAIALLNTLTQSIFIEMFGDPVKNLKSFPIFRLGDLTKISSGSTPSRKNSENFNGNIPWVKTTEVNERLITDTEEKITETALQNSSCHLYPVGSILIALYGQGKTRGQCAVLGIEAATNQACGVLLPNPKYETNFLFAQLLISYSRLRAMARGGNQENLNLGLIADFTVLLPPLSLQKEFAQRFEAVEELKKSHRASLSELDALFASLQHRAFRGEL
ncbi:restriction endonuclease subunit S [Cuspidothrix issatschenkoi]|uniref:Type I restriction modification DNA specificity domain-containing protein n=1 Tax=Cuspidothrix issatschenkoi CHARLIE-1 TaxID=2052836 RepID=A0A2S6CWN4_9CYAN|nr:restriction endonuclease subunit S [Cuspidothrix issatschenkoi]PPJ64195.1 hypothetical protein CUN59_06025 [Cuspidothrix issatschenkoi CHARLIE-1]